MLWPNNPTWSAGKDRETVKTKRGDIYTWVISCGSLFVPSGRLAVCDPFAFMRSGNNPHILTPTGRFLVTVTVADISQNLDRTHIREAYASIHFANGQETHRRKLPLAAEGEDRPETEGEDFIGFPVDAGTACFVDDSVLATCMPPESTWLENLFENERPDCWFARMDDPNEIRAGIANIRLPLAPHDENLILFHSGWGDGVYPVIGSYDESDRLLAAHIDFLVIP